jgi:hypothetical protein
LLALEYWKKGQCNCGAFGNMTKFVILIGEKGHWLVKKYRFIFPFGREKDPFGLICFMQSNKNKEQEWTTKRFCW